MDVAGYMDNYELDQGLRPREVYLCLRDDKQPGEASRVLARDGIAETRVNSQVVLGALIRVFGGEFALPFSQDTFAVRGAADQTEHFRVKATWNLQRGSIPAYCDSLQALEQVFAGWKPDHVGPISDKPRIDIAVKPADDSEFKYENLTGFNAPGVLKRQLAELAKYSRLPKNEVAKKLQAVRIHVGMPPQQK